jgi:hypothetical protein
MPPRVPKEVQCQQWALRPPAPIQYGFQDFRPPCILYYSARVWVCWLALLLGLACLCLLKGLGVGTLPRYIWSMHLFRPLNIPTLLGTKGSLPAHRKWLLTDNRHARWTGMPELGKRWGNVVVGEGRGVFFPRHSSFGVDPAPVAFHSCPLQCTMTETEVGSRIILFRAQ